MRPRRRNFLPILKFVLRRVLLGVVIMFVISILVFLATEALPGDAAVAKLGRSATPTALAAFRAHYHLDQPLIEQYFSWLGDLLHGDLGISLSATEPVGTLIGQRIGNSLVLFFSLVCLGFPLPSPWESSLRNDGTAASITYRA